MIFFKTVELKWWQASIFKSAMISIGILLGVYFTNFLAKFTTLFWIVAIVGAVYITYIWIKN